MCSGDGLAKMIVFSALMSLLQRFTFRRVDPVVHWSKVKRINGVGKWQPSFSSYIARRLYFLLYVCPIKKRIFTEVE